MRRRESGARNTYAPTLALLTTLVAGGCAHDPAFEDRVPYIEVPRQKIVVFPVKTTAFEIGVWDGTSSKPKLARTLASVVAPEIERQASRSGIGVDPVWWTPALSQKRVEGGPHVQAARKTNTAHAHA